MIRCFLLKELMNEIKTGTWGCVLHRVPDGRLKIIFDGQANCHLVPERFVRIVDDYPSNLREESQAVACQT